MLRSVLALTIVSAVVSGFAACGGDEARSAGAQSASDLRTRTRSIDRTLSVDTGHARVLYSVRGLHYGTVGRFVVSCSRSGVARTVYELAKKSPDAVVAVDGRGASRAGKLRSGVERFPGGSKRSGIEQWIVLTGGQPESIRLDASLLVRPEPGLGCDFSMRGTVVISLH